MSSGKGGMAKHGATQDYFGTYSKKEALKVHQTDSVSQAVSEARAASRDIQALTGSATFTGRIYKCKVRHYDLVLGVHTRHGRVGFILHDAMLGRAKVEVFKFDGEQISREHINRIDFFREIGDVELSEQEMQDCITAFEREYITFESRSVMRDIKEDL